MEIAQANPDQVHRIIQVFHVARKDRMPYLPELHTPEEDKACFTELLRKGGVLVARDGEKAVAFCAFHDGWIDHLYVLPSYQRKGVGTLLLNEAKTVSEELQLWVFQRNK